MRVLIIVEAGGGVARHVADLCCGLRDSGVEVHLLYSPLRADGVARAGLQRLKDAAIPATPIAMAHTPGFSDFFALIEIYRYLRTHGPFDVIHGHSSKGGALARLVPAGKGAVKVYSAHAFVTMNPQMGPCKRFFFAFLEKILARFGDAVIATSSEEVDHALSFLKLPQRTLHLIPNAIAPAGTDAALNRQLLRRQWGLGESDLVIGTVVRLVPQKDPETLIRAFALLSKRLPHVKLVVVGTGPLHDSLLQVAAELGIADRIVWPGFVLHDDLLSAFDIFALSSIYEGFPYVFLDALAAGLPVVTTRVGGADMVVSDGVNGFIVPKQSSEDFAGALLRVCSDPAVCRQMAMASRERAEDSNAEWMVSQLVKVYRNLLK